jgi:hypothetical protein
MIEAIIRKVELITYLYFRKYSLCSKQKDSIVIEKAYSMIDANRKDYH